MCGCARRMACSIAGAESLLSLQLTALCRPSTAHILLVVGTLQRAQALNNSSAPAAKGSILDYGSD